MTYRDGSDCPIIVPRKIYDERFPDFDIESDDGYIRRNETAAIWLLDNFNDLAKKIIHQLEKNNNQISNEWNECAIVIENEKLIEDLKGICNA